MSQEKTDMPGEQQTETVFETADTGERPQDADDVDVNTEDAPDAGEDPAALQAALQQAREQAEEYRDQALRAAAESQNIRKRAQRDVEAARKFALDKFATELLAVRDSLELGLAAGDNEQADAAKLVEGMQLTERMLANAMEKFGVEKVNPQGEAFNPELHEAVSMQETDSQPANTVVTVMQNGYTLNGRVLRAAMVVVAKAPSDDA